MKKIILYFQILRNMGVRYSVFRFFFELQKILGLLRAKFPTDLKDEEYISLDDWKQLKRNFFFESRENLNISKKKNSSLEQKALNIFEGKIVFFNSEQIHLGKDYDWITNPESNKQFPLEHWTKIVDLSKEMGDIKYVWEKSRFSYLLTIVRYDYHFDKDSSIFVFEEIVSWIDKNPINMGPNYRCSQEISIRVLNWLFILYFYKNSEGLTSQAFEKIINSIYKQLHHVYNNIHFSRIAVRNNHAITETLMLYLGGLLMPFFPNSNLWKKKGKKWFEEEVVYQIYDDGTFLQFSMNYHRVLVQLLSWAFFLAEKNGENFSEQVYVKAKKTINFLHTCQESNNGFLPNYGANDGALFFPLNNLHYRDYRPQIDALNYFFEKKHLYIDTGGVWEDTQWYTGNNTNNEVGNYPKPQCSSYDQGGYYIINEEGCKTFIKCGNYKDRPSQADNLHIDIWVNGDNILRDAGSYKYNTENDLINYFTGTLSHNTVSLGGENQMLRGSRFIWYNWIKSAFASLNDKNESFFIFEGQIEAFKHVNKGVFHKRIIKKYKGVQHWIILDTLEHNTDRCMMQIWNPSESFYSSYNISAEDELGNEITPIFKPGWYSSYYGIKEHTKQIIFKTQGKFIKTIIKLK